MLIPWSLGLIDQIDPLVARTYFWWFGHPLVYFWLLPAYVIWYFRVRRLRRRDQRGLRDEWHGAQHGVDHGTFPRHAGTTVALTFMGATYWLLPRLLGRDLHFMSCRWRAFSRTCGSPG
jgi:heme/copper-type cytochrome/quinol oxidase subunit 1